MDKVQMQRRRPVTTYGKTTRKKLPGIDEIFTPHHNPVSMQGQHSQNFTKANPVASQLLTGQAVLASNHRAKHTTDHRVHLGGPSLDNQVPELSIDSTMVITSKESNQKPRDIFDIQSSDDESPPRRLSRNQKRKRIPSLNPNTPAFAGSTSSHTQSPGCVSSVDIPPMEKRPRSAQSGQSSEATVTLKNKTLTTASKITKPSDIKKPKSGRSPSLHRSSSSLNHRTILSQSKSSQTTAPLSSQKLFEIKDDVEGHDLSKYTRNPIKNDSAESTLVTDQDLLTDDTLKSDLNFFGDEPPTQKYKPSKRLIDNLRITPRLPDSKVDSSDRAGIDRGLEYPSQMSFVGPHHSNDNDLPADTPVIAVAKPPISSGRPGSRVTYARERSFRIGEPIDELEFLRVPLPTVKSGNKRRLGQNNTSNSNDQEDDLNAKTTVKSIHELRAAAVNSRFNDDVEELFADIESTSMSTRRSGYHELVSKLQQKSFFQKFWAKSLYEKLFYNLDLQTDEIVRFLIAYMALCFLLDDSTPQTMLHLLNNGATVMLKNMLHQSKDILAIAKEKGLNMSKAAQGQLRDLRLIIEKSPAFVAQSLISISPQLLSLKVLEQIVTKYRHQGNFDAFLPQGVVYKIIEIVKPFLSLEKCPSQKVIHSHTLEICLSILESYAIGGSILMGDEISKENLSTVAGVFPTVQNWAQEKDLGPILLLSLRLNINITNNHADICDNLLHPRLLSALILVIESKFRQLSDNLEESSRLLSMDLLVLSLGLLLNLAELSPCAREMVQSSQVKVSESSETGLDRLLNTFLERLERSKDADSLEKTEANVALGYLSLVLGELCIDNHIRYRVRSKLPNASFVSLLDVLEEFMGHYRHVEEGPYHEQDLMVFTRRLELVTNRLRTYM